MKENREQTSIENQSIDEKKKISARIEKKRTIKHCSDTMFVS